LYYTVIWLSRISLSLSLARIFPPRHNCRRFAFCLTVFFSSLYTSCILLSIFTCWNLPGLWYLIPQEQCTLRRKWALYSSFTLVALEFVTDILLVVSPLVMLWKVKLPQSQRRLILALFCSSILSLLASVTFFMSWMLSSRIGASSYAIFGIVANLQVAISLLVCNLLVVTMFFYRIIRKEGLPIPNHTTTTSSHPSPTANELGIPSDGSTSPSRTTARTRETSNWTETSRSENCTALILTSLYDDSVRNPSTLPTNSNPAGIL